MNLEEQISKILRKKIKEEKIITAAKIAHQLKISQAAVSKWTNGKGLPKLNFLICLCNLLDVSPNELLGYEDDYALTSDDKAYLAKIKNNPCLKDVVENY